MIGLSMRSSRRLRKMTSRAVRQYRVTGRRIFDPQGRLVVTGMLKTMLAVVGLMALASCVSRADSPQAPAVLPPGGAGVLTWTPEQQEWGYKNMEKINPARVVKRGPWVRALPMARVQIEPKFAAEGTSYDTASYMRAFRASGVLVVKDGKIILERYGLGRRPHDRWTSFSVAKSVTSTLIGAAIKDGKIKGLDDPVTAYIPELRGSAYEGVTVRQLITMTSGVKWNENYTDPNSDVAKEGLTQIEPGVNPVVSYMRRLPREAEPGSKFVYKTGETDLAGILLSNAVGKPLSQYLSEKIWQPYGMEQDAIWAEDLAGHERGGCCMSMTLRDYGRFALFTLDPGRTGAGQVLPEGWMQDATREHVSEPPYGYFWWLTPGGYEAKGIFGQSVSIFPAERLVVVINSAWPAASDRRIASIRRLYIDAIRAAAHDQPR
jgi:CubicO group peptidase (beta-lactamase class C family)